MNAHMDMTIGQDPYDPSTAPSTYPDPFYEQLFSWYEKQIILFLRGEGLSHGTLAALTAAKI